MCARSSIARQNIYGGHVNAWKVPANSWKTDALFLDHRKEQQNDGNDRNDECIRWPIANTKDKRSLIKLTHYIISRSSGYSTCISPHQYGGTARLTSSLAELGSPRWSQ